MYILDLHGNIFTVDLSTGLASFLAETIINSELIDQLSSSIRSSMDIIFDANFTLYAQGNHPGGGSKLFTANSSTGAATSVGAFSESGALGLFRRYYIYH